jgi:hypothetical protein
VRDAAERVPELPRQVPEVVHEPDLLGPVRFNELFAEFLQACGLELTDLIPANKFMSQYLDIELVVQEQADLDLFGQSYNKELLLYTSMK